MNSMAIYQRPVGPLVLLGKCREIGVRMKLKWQT